MTRIVSLRRRLLLGATLLISGSALHAQAVRTGVDLSAEAEAISNPYLDEASPDWVGAGTLEIRPWLVSETAKDRLELEAFARGRAFTSGYDFEDSYGGSLRATHRASPRTNYYGQASVVSTSARSNFSRFDRNGFDRDPLTPLDPSTPAVPGEPPVGLGPVVVPPLDDLTIVGLQGRTTTLALAAGMNRQLDTRSTLSANLGYDKLWVEGNQISGYDSVSLDLSYSRRLSAQTSVGLSANAGQTRYDGAFPKTTTLGGYVNAEHQFNSTWSLTGAIGVSYSRSPATALVPEVEQIGLAGNVSVCRTQPSSRLCLGVSRSQQPSTLGQVRSSDSVNVNYSERLSARDRVDLYGNYARSSAPDEIATGFDEIKIVSVGATLTRTLTPRLEGYLFGRASRSYGGYLADEPSISFGVGIRALLGARR